MASDIETWIKENSNYLKLKIHNFQHTHSSSHISQQAFTINRRGGEGNIEHDNNVHLCVQYSVCRLIPLPLVKAL